MLKSNLKYLLLMPIILAIASIVFFVSVIDHVNDALLNEKFAEKQLYLDFVAAQLDNMIATDADWGIYDYLPELAYDMELLDAMQFSFGVVYNERLECKSNRAKKDEVSVFDPIFYGEFISMVKNSEQGEINIWFDDPKYPQESRLVRVYFKWVPSDTTLSGRYLLAVGVSQNSVDILATDIIGNGVIAITIITAVLNFAMIWIISFAGSSYKQKKQS